MWESEQTRILRSIDEHRAADRPYGVGSVKLFGLVKRAYELFAR